MNVGLPKVTLNKMLLKDLERLQQMRIGQSKSSRLRAPLGKELSKAEATKREKEN